MKSLPAALGWTGLALVLAPIALICLALIVMICIAVPAVGIGVAVILAAVLKAASTNRKD